MKKNLILHKVGDTKERIQEWIGSFDGLSGMSEETAEKILSFLEENNIDIEKPEDVQKTSDFVATLL